MAKQRVADKFLARRNADGSLTEVKADDDGGFDTMALKFVASGNVLELPVADILTADTWSAMPTIAQRLFAHGVFQKIGDSYSSLGDQPDEAEDAAQSIVEQLKAGNWAAKREAGEARPSLVGRAIFQLKTEAGLIKEGETEESYIAKYSGKDSASARAKALKSADVAARVAALKAKEATDRAAKLAERAAAKKAESGATAPVSNLGEM